MVIKLGQFHFPEGDPWMWDCIISVQDPFWGTFPFFLTFQPFPLLFLSFSGPLQWSLLSSGEMFSCPVFNFAVGRTAPEVIMLCIRIPENSLASSHLSLVFLLANWLTSVAVSWLKFWRVESCWLWAWGHMWAPLITEDLVLTLRPSKPVRKKLKLVGQFVSLCALSVCFIVQRLELEEVGTNQAGHPSQVGRATGSSGVHSAWAI